MEINWRVQRHPSSWLFVVKEMDGGSLCQLYAAAITPAAMMDWREGEGGWVGDGEREIQRRASITALNLPVTAPATTEDGLCWGGGLRGEKSKNYFVSLLWICSFCVVLFCFGELGLQAMGSLKDLFVPIDSPELIGFSICLLFVSKV